MGTAPRISLRQCAGGTAHIPGRRGTPTRRRTCDKSTAKTRVAKRSTQPSFRTGLLFLATDFCSKEPEGLLPCGAVLLTAGQSSCSSLSEKTTGPRRLPSGPEPGCPEAWSRSWKHVHGKTRNGGKVPPATVMGQSPRAQCSNRGSALTCCVI